MEKDFEAMLQEMVHGYRTECPSDAKMIEEAVEGGEADVLSTILFENANLQSLTTNEKLLHSVRLFYFLGYCLKYNNGIPMIELLSNWIDNAEKRKVENSVKSQTILFDFLLKKDIDIKILADYIAEKEIIEYALGENKKSTGVLKRLLNWKMLPFEKSGSYGSPLPSIKTKTDVLKENLSSHGFYELEKVKRLSQTGKDSLIKKISENSIPYAIAMFDYLQFIPALEKQFFSSKEKLNIEVSKWFGSDKKGRTVKGNISSLLDHSKENKSRYTAYKHKEIVKNDYEQLK